jgi:hypothetical protein
MLYQIKKYTPKTTIVTPKTGHLNMPSPMNEHTTTCHGFKRQNRHIFVILTDFVYNPMFFLVHWVMNAPLGWTKSYQCML